MGFISDAFGKGDVGSAGGRGAVQEQQFNQQAIDEISRQFGITQKNLKPFLKAGQRALPGVIEGTTIGGLDERLRDIFSSETFGGVFDEAQRAQQGQLAAGGLTRSGTALEAAGRLPVDIGLQIENLLSGRQTNLAGAGQNAAANLGSFGAQSSGNIAELLQGSGQAGSAGILTDAQTSAAGGQNILNAAATIGSIFFSDPNLKENVEQIGQIGKLPLVQWDWLPEAKTISLIAEGMTIGFLTTDVKQHFPQHVYTYCGFDCIDYPNLLEDLQRAA